jgi:hypothetical protein
MKASSSTTRSWCRLRMAAWNIGQSRRSDSSVRTRLCSRLYPTSATAWLTASPYDAESCKRPPAARDRDHQPIIPRRTKQQCSWKGRVSLKASSRCRTVRGQGRATSGPPILRLLSTGSEGERWSTGGTHTNLAELTGPKDPRHAEEVAAFFEDLLPHIYFAMFDVQQATNQKKQPREPACGSGDVPPDLVRDRSGVRG